MEVFREKTELRKRARAWKSSSETVALVPTMGALHEGHLSLIKIARECADRVVVSIFVNPAQFGPQEDFEKYPRTEDADLKVCASMGADAVFMPGAGEMYAGDSSVFVDESKLSKVLCGSSRPGHFRGVLTVVGKLFNIAQPDYAVFGRKDAQQLAMIQRMVRDLDFPVEILPAPIVREADGLAMSSRNRYLSESERAEALCLSEALALAGRYFADGGRDGAALRSEMLALIALREGVQLEYLEMVDAASLEPAEALRSGTLVALAAKVGSTRLIDNIVLEV